MGVGVCDALALEPLAGAAAPQKVVSIVDLVAALAQHGAAVTLADGAGSSLHVGSVCNAHAGQDLSLRDVGGKHLGQRQQLFGQRLHSIVLQQLCTGGGHHHRVHHNVLCAVEVQPLGNGVDERGRGYHADLHRIRVDVGEHGIELLCQKLRRGVKNGGHTGGVLCGQGGNGTHGKHAVGGHGLDIGLNSGAAAGITAGNGQCSFHG